MKLNSFNNENKNHYFSKDKKIVNLIFEVSILFFLKIIYYSIFKSINEFENIRNLLEFYSNDLGI
jgi:hypothetical protein